MNKWIDEFTLVAKILQNTALDLVLFCHTGGDMSPSRWSVTFFRYTLVFHQWSGLVIFKYTECVCYHLKNLMYFIQILLCKWINKITHKWASILGSNHQYCHHEKHTENLSVCNRQMFAPIVGPITYSKSLTHAVNVLVLQLLLLREADDTPEISATCNGAVEFA